MRLEKFFHCCALVVLLGGILPLFTRSADGDVELAGSSGASTLANATILIVTLILVARRGRDTMQFARAAWLILAVVGLAFVSAAWSDVPGITIRRAGSLFVTTLWAWYVGARFPLREIARMTMLAATALAVLSAVLAVAAPQLAISQPPDPPGIRGVFAQKNGMGAAMAVGAVSAIYVLATAGRSRGLAFLALVLIAPLLWLSESKTSLMVALVAALGIGPLHAVRGRAGPAVIAWIWAVLLGIPALIMLGENLDQVIPLLGRDATFTGRVDLWQEVIRNIETRPFLGFGLGGFWIEDSIRVQALWSGIGWQAPHAHSGWLDALLDLGIVGTSMILLQILAILWRATRALVTRASAEAEFVLLLVVVVLVNNLMESNLLRVQSFYWAALMFSTIGLARIARTPAEESAPDDALAVAA